MEQTAVFEFFVRPGCLSGAAFFSCRTRAQYDSSGNLGIDVPACENEVIDGQPLLHEVMTDGRRGADLALICTACESSYGP